VFEEGRLLKAAELVGEAPGRKGDYERVLRVARAIGS
jgi:hypothetical protein